MNDDHYPMDPLSAITGPIPQLPLPRRTVRRRRWRLMLVVIVTVTALVGCLAWAIDRASDQIVALTLVEQCTVTVDGSSTQVTPEQAGNAAIIATTAERRDLPLRAAVIAIATAMQESKLKNLSYGDRDSLGLFQQRPSSGWGTEEEILDPVYASRAFYKALVKVDGWQDMSLTEAAQEVQRSAYPDAYAQHEEQAQLLAEAFTGKAAGGLTCTLKDVTQSVATQNTDQGEDGLVDRARAVVNAAGAETVAEATAADGSGYLLGMTFTGGEAAEHAWGTAQWAVARADDLDVVSVSVSGVDAVDALGAASVYTWDRGDSVDGWQPGTDVAATTATTAGQAQDPVVVRIEVAHPAATAS